MSFALAGLAALLMAGVCAATLFALNEKRPDPTWWDGWTKRILLAGLIAFLLFHVDGGVRAFSDPGWKAFQGYRPVTREPLECLLDGAWLAWSGLGVLTLGWGVGRGEAAAGSTSR